MSVSATDQDYPKQKPDRKGGPRFRMETEKYEMENGLSLKRALPDGRAAASEREPSLTVGLLPGATGLGLCGAVRLRGVVKLARLDHVFLVVVDPVAVNVDADFDLVLLAVVNIAGIESEAVLAAQ